MMLERTNVGQTASLVGLAANLLLAGTKILIGLLSGALSILGDGLNNLFDAASAVVSLIAFRLSGMLPDRRHPFGHARAEYLGSSIIAIVIVYVAITLFIQGVTRTLHPEPVSFTLWQVLVLILSILIKVGLVIFYRRMARKIDSGVLLATAEDARSDVFATSAILAALVLSPLIGFPLDGPFAILVALIIGRNGISILLENINEILGSLPDESLVTQLTADILAFEGVLGIHDLIVHDYGPGRQFATVHVEVDGEVSALISHELIDQIEREMGDKYGMEITIHMDPVQPSTPELEQMLFQITEAVHAIDIHLDLHDFRVISRAGGRNILFDVVVPWDHTIPKDKLAHRIETAVQAMYPNDTPLVTIERALTVMENQTAFEEGNLSGESRT